jgi:hypothetical protein
LAPTVDGSDDLIWVGGPDEGFRVPVGLGEVSVDGGLEVDDGAENAALQSPPGQCSEEGLDPFSQEQEVGVKWKVKR